MVLEQERQQFHLPSPGSRNVKAGVFAGVKNGLPTFDGDRLASFSRSEQRVEPNGDIAHETLASSLAEIDSCNSLMLAIGRRLHSRIAPGALWSCAP